jgi:hypothetical protein
MEPQSHQLHIPADPSEGFRDEHQIHGDHHQSSSSLAFAKAGVIVMEKKEIRS